MTHLEIIGRVWSDWSITEKLGEGSFGQVFKAEKERYGIIQNSAIKVVRIPSDDAELKRVQSGFGLDEQELRDYFYPQIEKLKKEIVLMQELGEDNHIVKILDFEIIDSPSDNICWYILIRMEFLECLDKYVKQADLTVGDVISIGEDILTGLEVCETNNIIHRDIKPANIFRSSKGIYKLGDFGIARDIASNAGTLSYKGTENYMAPEVYLGKRYGSNIDIYSLGVVLYKLLNRNRLPFMNEEKLTAGSVEKAVQKRYTGEEFPKPVQASEDLYKILQKMCAYKPEQRFQSAVDAKRAITEYKHSHTKELEESLGIKNKFASGVQKSQVDTQVKAVDNNNYIIPAVLDKTDTKDRVINQVISDEADITENQGKTQATEKGTITRETDSKNVLAKNQNQAVQAAKEVTDESPYQSQEYASQEYTKNLYPIKDQDLQKQQTVNIETTSGETTVSKEEALEQAKIKKKEEWKKIWFAILSVIVLLVFSAFGILGMILAFAFIIFLFVFT